MEILLLLKHSYHAPPQHKHPVFDHAYLHCREILLLYQFFKIARAFQNIENLLLLKPTAKKELFTILTTIRHKLLLLYPDFPNYRNTVFLLPIGRIEFHACSELCGSKYIK